MTPSRRRPTARADLKKAGKGMDGRRTPLSAAISHDDGLTLSEKMQTVASSVAKSVA